MALACDTFHISMSEFCSTKKSFLYKYFDSFSTFPRNSQSLKSFEALILLTTDSNEANSAPNQAFFLSA